MLAALAGCAVGPNFHEPVVASPPAWGPERTDVPSRTVSAQVDPTWWRGFHDPTLDLLVDRLVAQNLDLQVAAERVLQERDQRQIAASRGLPQINEQSFYRRERQSQRGTLSLIEPVPGAPLEYDIYQNGVNSSWQLDLFGRVRRSVEAQNAAALAAVWNRRGIALSALSELAQDYLQLRGTQLQLAIAQRNLRDAARNTALVATQFRNGVATTLEMAQAKSQEATIATTLAPLATRQAALVNAIGLLLAEPPRALQAELQEPRALPAVPPTVPVGLPGTLVRRRPDVQEAEARLHEATAQTGVAVAEFYPDVSLTGSFALNGLRFSDAFSLPARMFDVGPTIDIPIFQGGRLRGRLHLRQSQQREAALDFQRIVLRAWQEVDDALTAYAQAQSARDASAEAVRQNQAALAAARQRYDEGAADFLNVIASEGELLRSENDLANLDTQIATDLVNLYRALGGGWEVSEPGQPPPPVNR